MLDKIVWVELSHVPPMNGVNLGAHCHTLQPLASVVFVSAYAPFSLVEFETIGPAPGSSWKRVLGIALEGLAAGFAVAGAGAASGQWLIPLLHA